MGILVFSISNSIDSQVACVLYQGEVGLGEAARNPPHNLISCCSIFCSFPKVGGELAVVPLYPYPDPQPQILSQTTESSRTLFL